MFKGKGDEEGPAKEVEHRKQNENVCKKECVNSFSASNACNRLSNLKTDYHTPLAIGEPLVTLIRAISVA